LRVTDSNFETRFLSSEYTQVAATASNSDNKYVKTLRFSVDPSRMETDEAQAAIAQAAQILRAGGLVALPTETVYGLGANALDAAAVTRIFLAKQRPSWDPIIVHIAGPVHRNPMLEQLVTKCPPVVRGLMEAFWPGPLTMLLPRSEAVPDVVTAGRPLVGIRMPAHPVAFEIIRQAGVPIAAPSANVFGHISPTTAAHVLEDLDGKIDAVVDAGPTRHGVESTVLDPMQSPMMIYRPGAITAQQIREVAGPVDYFEERMLPDNSLREALPSPGIGLRHYAPRARLILVEGSLAELPARLADAADRYAKDRLGVMLPVELAHTKFEPPLRGAAEFPWGHWNAPEELAEKLYAGLRALDAEGCTVILCPLPQGAGIGEAIRDRLRKASHT
jgi:L-threonylcarbamoyladenylate synthase